MSRNAKLIKPIKLLEVRCEAAYAGAAAFALGLLPVEKKKSLSFAGRGGRGVPPICGTPNFFQFAPKGRDRASLIGNVLRHPQKNIRSQTLAISRLGLGMISDRGSTDWGGCPPPSVGRRWRVEARRGAAAAWGCNYAPSTLGAFLWRFWRLSGDCSAVATVAALPVGSTTARRGYAFISIGSNFMVGSPAYVRLVNGGSLLSPEKSTGNRPRTGRRRRCYPLASRRRVAGMGRATDHTLFHLEKEIGGSIND